MQVIEIPAHEQFVRIKSTNKDKYNELK